jgi:F-type H+-transporting ATPase subunit b
MKVTSCRIAVSMVALSVLWLAPLRAQEAGSKPEATARTSEQPQPAAEQAQPSTEPSQAHPVNPNRAAGRELAEASKAAEGEPEEKGENVGLKHSVMVRRLANLFGISVETAYWIAMAFNFAIIALVILWFMKSSLPGYFRSRNEAIARGIDEARAASADAQRRLTDIEQRLAKMDGEVAQIRASAESESAAEEARIRAAAETDVKRILEQAEQEIDAAGRQARRDLKGLAAGLAVDLAAGKLRIDQETDEGLIHNFVAQLGKDGR